MKVYKKVKKEVEVLDKFICDICGKDMTCCESNPLDDNGKEIKDYFKTNDRDFFKGGDFRFDFSYGSKRDCIIIKEKSVMIVLINILLNFLKKLNILKVEISKSLI